MSKEVKRYELRIVDRYSGDGTGDIETDARMKQEAKGRYVLFSDYEALLADRDRMEKALKEIDAADWSSSESATDNEISMAKGSLIRQMKRIASAALQGAQP